MTTYSYFNHFRRLNIMLQLLRYGIFGLLLINLYFFLSQKMIVQSIDAIAWQIILVMIEWPKNESFKNSIAQWYLIIWILPFSMISISCFNSLIQENWISLFNELTWLSILLLPQNFYQQYKFLKPIMYISLLVYAIYWGGVEKAILDCYDAILWICAFLQLEFEKNNTIYLDSINASLLKN